MKIVKRVPCDRCAFKQLCKNGGIEVCPCKECLVKAMCITVCMEADIFFKESRQKVIQIGNLYNQEFYLLETVDNTKRLNIKYLYPKMKPTSLV